MWMPRRSLFIVTFLFTACPGEAEIEPTPEPEAVNAAPSARIIDPAAGDPLDNLTPFELRGRIADAEDAADRLAVAWSSGVDGDLSSDAADVEGLAIAEVLLTAGEHTITLAVTDSAGVESTATLILDVNGAPTAPEVELAPRYPFTTDDLVATLTVESTDEDGPEVVEHEISWTRDGEAMTEFLGLWTVPSDATRKGEEWAVHVVGGDGQSVGPRTSAAATIENTPPTADVPTLTPLVITAFSTAECVDLVAVDPDDDEVTIEVTWWVGGVDIGEVGPTLSDAFGAGDVLQCVATPHDGEEAGDSVPSLEALVANTLPGTPDVVIQPALPMTADPLDCSLTGPAADADGQTLSYDVVWLVGGASSGITALSVDDSFVLTVPASSTTAGDEWTCEVVASDGEGQGPTGSATVVVGCVADTGEGSVCAATSCQELLDGGFSTGDGFYWLDPASLGADLFECDMTTDTGGWTGVSFPNAENLAGTMFAVDGASTAAIDPVSGPYTRDGSGDHTYHYTFDFPPAFDEFYLDGWVIKAYAASGATSEIYSNGFLQSDWTLAQSCPVGTCGTGDVSWGDAAAAGPVASYARVLAANFSCQTCTTPYPAGSTVYAVGPGAVQFRLGWGEGGSQAEGWRPWWQGTVFLR
jgi:hypothetical protein